jgi:hypothetical protein
MAQDQGAGRHAYTFIWTDMGSSDEVAFNRWYNTEHVRDRVLHVPGYISGRRFINVGEGPKYFALYRVKSAQVFDSEAYLNLQRHPDENSRYFIPRFENVHKIFATLVAQNGQGEGACLALIPLAQAFPQELAASCVDSIVQALTLAHQSAHLVSTQFIQTDWRIVNNVTAQFLRKTDTYLHGAIILEAVDQESLNQAIDSLQDLMSGPLAPYLHKPAVGRFQQILSFHPPV